MLREGLIFVGTCDIAGHVRGKGFPARELAARKKQGIGWTHTNLMQTAFGTILDTPFGTGGDLMVVPASTRARRTRVWTSLAPDRKCRSARRR
jgi:glutamine synthetase